MAENDAPVSTEDDIPDVSLIDTPLDAPLTKDEPITTADDKPNDGADDQDKPKDDDSKTGDDAKPSEAKDDQGDKKPEDQQPDEQKPAPQTKEERDQAAQQAWKNRQRDRQQIAEQIDNSYAPKTAEELIAEGAAPSDAAIEALRQTMEFTNERNRVSELNAMMRTEAVEVIHDFPIFDPKSPEFDADFTKDVEESYKDAARLQTNDDGSLILNADKSLYDHYQRMARIYSRGTSKGAVKGQEQALDQMSRTENPGGSSSTNGPAPGSLEEMEERLANVPIT